MKNRLFILSIFVLFFTQVNAQYLNSVGARQGALGNTGVTLSDIWSNYHNQAGLSGIKNITAGIYFSNTFGVKELGTKSFATAIPVSKIGTFGLNYYYFGYGLFNQSKMGLAYGMDMGKKISAGIQLDYFLINQGLDYGKTGTFCAELGMIAEPVENLKIGVHIFNPTRSKIYENERMPSILKIGAGYNFSEKVNFTLEIEKDLEFETIFKSGIEYNVINTLYIRGGISSQPTNYTFGLGYSLANVNLNIAFVNHQQLGYTTQFGLSYKLQLTNNNEQLTN